MKNKNNLQDVPAEMADTWLPAPVAPSTTTKTAEDYEEAGRSKNTVKAYASDIKHFLNWGGLLPSSIEQLRAYISHYASSLSVSTLNRRIVGLSHWHKEQGFADPTEHARVKSVMQGIRKMHNLPPKKAKALTLQDLIAIVTSINNEIAEILECGVITAATEKTLLRCYRNKSMLLMGFWRAFRADTLVNLHHQHIQTTKLIVGGGKVDGLTIYLPSSKTDRSGTGESFTVSSMNSILCPVLAYNDWLKCLTATNSPIKGIAYPKIPRHQDITGEMMVADGLSTWLKRLCNKAGLADPETYSSHSMRRGLANLMADNNADVQTLMEYVGWKSSATAMGYLDHKSKGIDLLLSVCKPELPEQ